MIRQINPFRLKNFVWKPATKKNITQYYQDEFLHRMSDLPPYLQNPRYPSEYAFAPLNPVETLSGTRDFLRRTNTSIRSFSDLRDLCLDFKNHDPIRTATSSQPMRGVYFALNGIREHGWLLAFDIDAKTIAENGMCKYHDGYADSPRSVVKTRTDELANIPPVSPVDGHEYLYCFNCIHEAMNQAFVTKEILVSWGFDEHLIHIFYSGQGSHIHVADPACWTLKKSAREFIQEMLIQKHGIPLDTTVTTDEKRVLRLPGTLNGNVNRPVLKVTKPDFDISKLEKVALSMNLIF